MDRIVSWCCLALDTEADIESEMYKGIEESEDECETVDNERWGDGSYSVKLYHSRKCVEQCGLWKNAYQEILKE